MGTGSVPLRHPTAACGQSLTAGLHPFIVASFCTFKVRNSIAYRFVEANFMVS